MKVLFKFYSWGFVFLFSLFIAGCLGMIISQGLAALIIAAPISLISYFGIKAGINLKNRKREGWVVCQILLMFVLSLCTLNVFCGLIYNDTSLLKENLINVLVLAPFNYGLYPIRKEFFPEVTKKLLYIAFGGGLCAGLLLFTLRHTIMK